MKIKDRAQSAEGPVVARPISSSSVPSNPLVARPIRPSAGSSPSHFPSADFQPAATSDWNQLPMPPSLPVNYGQASRTNTAPRGNGQLWLWIALGGVGFLILGVTASVFAVWSLSKGTQVADSKGGMGKTVSRGSDVGSNNQAAAGGNKTNDKSPFPRLGPDLPFKDKILFHRVMIPRPPQRPLIMNIFIPKGNHADHSLPVMLEAPNGTNLLHGAGAEFPKPSTEYLPFTEQGMITVTFSIDGEMPRNLSPAAGELYFRQLQKAYKEFVDSDAGVENGKLALDYALAQIPAADSKRVYIWGHSSSATLALLMASKDKRITKCIALAPITDLNARLGDLLTDRSVSSALPGIKEYLVSGSPLTHVGDLKCPVFLAHAKDDDNEPFQNSQAYVKALQATGGNIVFEARTSGGHYQELLDASVPKAITWINESR